MRPVWALGFGDAGWLFAHRGAEKRATVAVFPLALKGTKDDGTDVGHESGEARLTRAIPLYLAERLFVETTCDAPMNVLVVPNQGPLVTGDPLGREALLRAAGDPMPSALVYGTLAREEVPRVRATLEITSPDGRRSDTLVRVGDEVTLDFVDELADAVISFAVDGKLCERVKAPEPLARPPATHTAPYVGAIGQLLAQALAESHVIPVSSLWDEVGMLAWYERLRTEVPALLAPRLIQLRGLLLSKSYGGKEAEARLPLALAELEQADAAGELIARLSPVVFAKAGKPEACEAAKARLGTEKDAAYAKWLGAVQCRANATLN
jgi:hypothetical protein